MVSPHELYSVLDENPAGVAKCPVCHAPPSLWQFTEKGGTASKLVCCTRGDPFGPQVSDHVGLMNEGCLLFMPPDAFYRATRREAINYWNAYAEALTTLRELAP